MLKPLYLADLHRYIKSRKHHKLTSIFNTDRYFVAQGTFQLLLTKQAKVFDVQGRRAFMLIFASCAQPSETDTALGTCQISGFFKVLSPTLWPFFKENSLAEIEKPLRCCVLPFVKSQWVILIFSGGYLAFITDYDLLVRGDEAFSKIERSSKSLNAMSVHSAMNEARKFF